MDTSQVDHEAPQAIVRFTEALDCVRNWAAHKLILPKEMVVLRDLRGRFRLILGVAARHLPWRSALPAISCTPDSARTAQAKRRSSLPAPLPGADQLLKSRDLRPRSQRAGRPETARPRATKCGLAPDRRINSGLSVTTFYGLKGGVGRSTALALVAFKLAEQGRKYRPLTSILSLRGSPRCSCHRIHSPPTASSIGSSKAPSDKQIPN